MKKKLAVLFAVVFLAAININWGNDKVRICHKGHEIIISVNALDAHLAHGDEVHEWYYAD